jgi:cell division septal protein FtsQ
MSPETRESSRAVFRRRRFSAHRKRQSLWPVLLRGFSSALVLVGIPAAAAMWVVTSPSFGVREVRIETTEHVPAAWVETVVAPLAGQNLVLLSLSRLGERLGRHPWVERVELRKDLPDALRIRVVERTPAALLRREGELLLVDARGEVIAPFRPEAAWADLLLVTAAETGGDASEVLGVASELARIHPAWSAGLSEIEAISLDAYKLHSKVYPFPVVIDRADVRSQIAKLMRWWPRISSRIEIPALVDLRFANQMIIRTAARPLD